MTAKAWNYGESITLQTAWKKMIEKPGVKNLQNVVQLISETEMTTDLTEIHGFSDCEIEEVRKWLNTDVDDFGYQIMTNEEIIDSVNEDNEALSLGEESEEEYDDTVPTYSEVFKQLKTALKEYE